MRTRTSMVAALALLALFVISGASRAQAACSSPAGSAGGILYNSTNKVFQYCDDTAWVPMNLEPGSGAGGCSLVPSGSLSEGRLIYHEDHRVMTGCAGNVQRPFGPIGGQDGWISVAFGHYHACGIKSSGTLWCWGWNRSGQLGDGTTTWRWEATQVSGGGSWKQVNVGYEHTCAIKNDDTLWCWGDDANGRLGNGNTTDNWSPTAVTVTGAIPDTWKSVSLGFSHTCAIGIDDTAWCWGADGSGQRGDAAVAYSNIPNAVDIAGAIPDTWSQISAGNAFTCGVGTNGAGYCWGSDSDGKLGNGATAGNQASPSAINIAGAIPDTWKMVSANQSEYYGSNACGLASDDTIWCWGDDYYYLLGDDTTQDPDQVSPIAISVAGAIPDTWKSVSIGHRTACALTSADVLWCWGGYSWAAAGNAVDGSYPYTARAISGGLTWRQVAMGTGSSAGNNDVICGVTTTGRLTCWGGMDTNFYGETPVGAASAVPAIKDGASSWKVLANSNEGPHHCGIKSDDTLWCWGWNYFGQLGNNSTTNSGAPVQVNGGGTWKDVSIGWKHTCGIKSDDTLWCWGHDGYEQMGNGAGLDSTVPVAVSGGGTWKKVAAAELHTCGIKSDDTLWCWGTDVYGNLGNGAGGNANVPGAVSGGGTWKTVAGGYLHACAIRSDDTLWCWGYNGYGEVGDNSVTQRDVPTAVNVAGSIPDTWKQVDGGESTTCAIGSDDTGWCWGYGGYGTLGNGGTGTQTVPTAISGGGTWKQIDAGGWFHSCGIKSDDMAYCWGGAGLGAIGSGSFFSRQDTPAAVVGGQAWKDVVAAAYNSCAISNIDSSLWCWGIMTDSGHTWLPAEMMDKSCSSPNGKAGKLVYNSSSNLMQYCDGVSWVRINK